MTRSLSSRQSELTQRDARRPIPLVKLTTYSNRDALTVDTVFYFSDRAALYDYGNTAVTQNFWPFLMQIGDLVSTMTHFPSPAMPTLESMQIKLRNGEIAPGGLWLSEHLRTKNIHFATVEISELDLDREPDYCDFTSLVGDEHVVWYRGELVNIGDVTQTEITLTFTTVMPRISWAIVSDATTADLRDLGKRLPLPYGARNRAPCLGVTVGWRTTLAQAITDTETGNIDVGDATGFPGAGSFTLRVAGEEMTVSYVNATTISISLRAINSTVAAAHLNGTVCVEMVTTAIYCPAGYSLSDVNTVWIVNPFNGQLVRVDPTSLYSVNTSATVAGVTATTISFTAANMRTLLNTLEQQAIVAQQTTISAQASISSQPTIGNQPVFTNNITASVTNQHPTGGAADLRDNNTTTGDAITAGGDTGNMTWTDMGTVVEQTIYIHVDGVASDLELRTGAGTLVGTITNSSSGMYSFTTAIDTDTFKVSNIGGATRGVNELWRDILFNANDPTRTTDVTVTNVSLSGATLSPAEIAAAEFGYGLEFYADVEGVLASGGNYSVGNGTLLQHPSDIIRYVIAELCGEGHGAIEDASFDASVTNLPSAALACSIDELDAVEAGILGRLAFEARSNLVPVQTATVRKWRLLQAQSTYDFPAATVATITEGEWTEHGIDADEISTRLRAIYDRDPSLGTDIDAYRAVVRIDVDQNDVSVPSVGDLTAAEASYGRRELDAIELPCTSSLATAEGMLGYLAHESIRAPRTYIGTDIPWWDAYALELGDIVPIEVEWRSGTIKGRVVSYRKSFDSQLVELGVVEVE